LRLASHARAFTIGKLSPPPWPPLAFNGDDDDDDDEDGDEEEAAEPELELGGATDGAFLETPNCLDPRGSHRWVAASNWATACAVAKLVPVVAKHGYGYKC